MTDHTRTERISGDSIFMFVVIQVVAENRYDIVLSAFVCWSHVTVEICVILLVLVCYVCKISDICAYLICTCANTVFGCL